MIFFNIVGIFLFWSKFAYKKTSTDIILLYAPHNKNARTYYQTT